jgi:AraC-like DNA-binding protein
LFDPQKLPADFPLYVGTICPVEARPITYLHVHDCLEIGICLEGAGLFVVEDRIYPFSKGDASVIPAGEWHLARSVDGCTSLWTFINIDPVGLLMSSTQESGILSTSGWHGDACMNILSGREYPEVASLIQSISHEMVDKDDYYRSAIRGMVMMLMALLHRTLPRNESAEKTTGKPWRIGPALAYLAHRYAYEVRIEELAAVCGTSPTNLRRLFRSSIQQTPHEYLTRLRMNMASSLLRSTDERVTEIALSVGYQSISSFNRHFRRLMGVSPSEWRNAHADAG